MLKDLKEYSFKSNKKSLKNMFSFNCLLIFILVSSFCARFQSNGDHFDKIVRVKQTTSSYRKTDFNIGRTFSSRELLGCSCFKIFLAGYYD